MPGATKEFDAEYVNTDPYVTNIGVSWMKLDMKNEWTGDPPIKIDHPYCVSQPITACWEATEVSSLAVWISKVLLC